MKINWKELSILIAIMFVIVFIEYALGISKLAITVGLCCGFSTYFHQSLK